MQFSARLPRLFIKERTLLSMNHNKKTEFWNAKEEYGTIIHTTFKN